jgi:aspartyl protease family protein
VLAERLILIVLVVGTASIVIQNFAIDLPEQPVRSKTAKSATPTRASYGGVVRIPRDNDGHFYADILVDRAPVHVLIDTGASVLLLRETDATAAGLHVMPRDFTYPVQTANGTSMVARVQADEIELGNLRIENVVIAVARDDQLFASLLGMNVLSKLGRVEFDDSELVIRGD